jgi:soluble lytic murein transglycosylase
LTFGNIAAAAPGAPDATAAAVPSSSQHHAADREWLAARDAWTKRDVPALSQAKSRFESPPRASYPLAHYVTYWWLTAELSAPGQNRQARALGREIEEFLSKHADTPLAEPLRRDWLRALGKADEWGLFGRHIAGYAGEDIEVACQRHRRSIAEGDATAIARAEADAKALFMLHKSAPEACYEVFSHLMRRERVSTHEGWARVRRLFESMQLADARRTAGLIASTPAGFEAASASANIDAKRFLQRHVVRAGEPSSEALALLAVARLARQDAEAAATWLERNQSRMSREAGAESWAALATQAALQLNPQALAWFERSDGAALSEAQAAWRVRAAIREAGIANGTIGEREAWAKVKRAVLTLPEGERREPAWRYWLARAEAAEGHPAGAAAARALREALAREDHFYGVLAAEEIGAARAPNFVGSRPDESLVDEVAARRSILRALHLFRLIDLKPDIRNEALREWQFAIRGMDDKTLLAAAEVGRRHQLPDRAINTAERTKNTHDFSVRYPLLHREALTAEARTHGLPPEWVYGLIRQESRFMTDTRSRVGALGLMQLMPATAQWSAKQVGIKNYSVDKVVEVPVNLSLGSFYLRHVLDDLGHPVLATAAYNAGPGRARRWRADTPLEGAIYAESIPFNETRDYVQKVMLNKWYYGHRLNGASPALKDLLGTVPGKSAPRNMTASLTSAESSHAPRGAQ